MKQIIVDVVEQELEKIFDGQFAYKKKYGMAGEFAGYGTVWVSDIAVQLARVLVKELDKDKKNKE